MVWNLTPLLYVAHVLHLLAVDGPDLRDAFEEAALRDSSVPAVHESANGPSDLSGFPDESGPVMQPFGHFHPDKGSDLRLAVCLSRGKRPGLLSSRSGSGFNSTVDNIYQAWLVARTRQGDVHRHVPWKQQELRIVDDWKTRIAYKERASYWN